MSTESREQAPDQQSMVTTDGPVTGEVTDGATTARPGEVAPGADAPARAAELAEERGVAGQQGEGAAPGEADVHDHHDHGHHDHGHHGHGHGHGHAHDDLPPVPEASGGVSTSRSDSVSVEDVTEAMKDVVDPELGINVVDLGLVYGVHVDEDSNAVIDMTLTSAACPLTDVITDQTVSALEGLVSDVAINWVWMPPWGPDKITDDGRDQLRALGFNV